jgi:hypothetical protein
MRVNEQATCYMLHIESKLERSEAARAMQAAVLVLVWQPATFLILCQS